MEPYPFVEPSDRSDPSDSSASPAPVAPVEPARFTAPPVGLTQPLLTDDAAEALWVDLERGPSPD